MSYATLADKHAFETAPFAERITVNNVFERLAETASRHGPRPALSFQIKSGEKDKAETLSWSTLKGRTAQAANLFRDLGVGPNDVVAYLLPNANEAAIALLGGMTAGIVSPINPLLKAEQIGEILAETGAKVLVTLAPFPKTDVAEKAAKALSLAPNVKHVLTVDLKRYLTPPLSWIVPLIRPKANWPKGVRVADFNAEMAKEDATLKFPNEATRDTICAYFHTGGTTGMPKVAQHNHGGALYNGWVADAVLATPDDVLLCPLPMFHVFAAYPVLMACVTTGAHMVMPTPQGYRGDGVFDNFWKLVERWGVTFMIMVPTAASALMQRPINADVSSLKSAFCGSAPLPHELFRQFEKATGVNILEGYGMTEATCVISANPPHGEKKIGSVGIPFPYTDVKILDCAPDGSIKRECGVDEIGEICVLNPGTFPGYTDARRNDGVFATGGHLRTGDLGKFDADGYLWITGRAKDLIIRGGHNIDPAVIEEALMAHPAVAFVGAIGQPDAHAGEVPSAYVELKEGASVTGEELVAYVAEHISEPAAIPKYVEVMEELPKTAVGKVFKPDLRRAAIRRIYAAALDKAGVGGEVVDVVDSKETGLTAIVSGGEDEAITAALGRFPRPWARAA
ncbi:acyl-CoA synthetase [Pikeienuella piscinae]|uniref:Acyl-CoA synthetase n=1 Tax=Pikeienuella piscinae TaxID=2748098 RepID=A0A7L5BSU5_9RHOB|nr:acyl-CoA synthetase [Pikeienuella piscinae]QIE54770.1 acyl-CoA synthetase [Pikeienuella piscinae]